MRENLLIARNSRNLSPGASLLRRDLYDRGHFLQYLVAEVTFDLVAVGERLDGRDFPFAHVCGHTILPPAPRLERTSRRRVDRRGDVALKHDMLFFNAGFLPLHSGFESIITNYNVCFHRSRRTYRFEAFLWDYSLLILSNVVTLLKGSISVVRTVLGLINLPSFVHFVPK